MLPEYVVTLQKKKGIWLKLPLENAELVPIAVKVISRYLTRLSLCANSLSSHFI